VNKNNDNFEYNEDPNEFYGHKWTLKTFWKYLEMEGHDTQRIWRRIKNVMIKTVMCGYPDIVQVFKKESQSDYNSYKLFGVDFFLDEALKPWLLELNNFPSMEKASLDRYVNDPMIAEMFNVVGFHYTGKPNYKQKQALVERYHLDDSKIEFEPKLYSRVKSEEQIEKEEYYHCAEEALEPEDYQDMVEEENLTPRDLRLLVRAEEELEQCNNFTRIFPSAESSKFLKYITPLSYSDYLLDGWERRYGDHRDRGREVLRSKCILKMHLEK